MDEDGPADDQGSDKDKGAPPLPTKQNPLMVAIYGQICIAAKSYQSAICTWSSFFSSGWDAELRIGCSLSVARV